ncbi:peptide chain release factor N(5)-glutamine methyltransferase [Phaeovibrio sulfidiphilus]|uniref:Release factor glutamine methyltransferase n=1 Tax=Phaeovibrio sulfidiphilus TaxID=1220600 RepID=A0A8J7CVR6_9PROT|nr:peptide chain release factor N(5)-glutamine methyltransferase [Phaeovibrio sulfidiphilus]
MSADTLSTWVRNATARLSEAGLAEPRSEARALVRAFLGSAAAAGLGDDQPLNTPTRNQLDAALERRCQREPLSRILGRRGFWSLELGLCPDTLDPRPDTETLVEGVLRREPDRAAASTLVDVGTGTGCILLALLSERPRATGLGIDISPAAARQAHENAVASGLAARCQFVVGDLLTPVRGPVDVIVSNPPYIPAADIAGLEPEVTRYDPLRALDGGPDGLDFYRRLVPAAAARLRDNGLLGLEIGQGQDGDVCALLELSGFQAIECDRDLGGIVRCVFGRWAPGP